MDKLMFEIMNRDTSIYSGPREGVTRLEAREIADIVISEYFLPRLNSIEIGAALRRLRLGVYGPEGRR